MNKPDHEFIKMIEEGLLLCISDMKAHKKSLTYCDFTLKPKASTDQLRFPLMEALNRISKKYSFLLTWNRFIRRYRVYLSTEGFYIEALSDLINIQDQISSESYEVFYGKLFGESDSMINKRINTYCKNTNGDE